MRLEANQVTYRHRGSPNALLDGLSHVWQEGSLTAVMGPSGSGKSTLLDLLGAIRKPLFGEVSLVQEDLGKDSTLARQEHQLACSWVLQSNLLLRGRSVLDNVSLTVRFQGMGRRAAEAESARVLGLLGLDDRLHAVPSELSGGEQQRVTVARSVLSASPVLLADEPTGNLDSLNTSLVVDALKEAARSGKAVIVATHDPSVSSACDEVLDLRTRSA